ncbi:carbohydrate kinase family protein [Treponema sp. OMZ 840]|uniref:PfkB family carbohydrate kinase n=1 Tax=Treponema sp. OMZ 840 TaxID=244313 RepID=UPI003D90AFCE
MKEILVIGSTVADVIIHIDELPRRAEDVHVIDQKLQLGGCAYNVASAIRKSGVPCTLCSPVGTGAYGDFVRKALKENGIPIFTDVEDKDNGCCYCFIDKTGERTFMSWHGAEYVFNPDWMDKADVLSADSIYICGLEVEEPTGEILVRWLEDTFEQCSHTDDSGVRSFNKCLYFAPGPRLCRIPLERMERLFALNPFLHLNEEEALSFTGARDIEHAAHNLAGATKNTVVITLGKNGVYCLEDGINGYTVPSAPVCVRNTNGAGDAHMGSLIAALKKGKTLSEALKEANEAAAALVCGFTGDC